MRKPRRATLVIDQLNSGGAQRDLARLASGLAAANYEVTVLTYWPGDFFASELAEAGVPVERVRSRNRLHLIYAMRRAIRRSRPDVVLSFLRGANILAELAGLPRRTFAVIALELNLDTQRKKPEAQRALRRLHRSCGRRRRQLARAARTNEQDRPVLADRTSVIVNGVDLSAFAPPPSPPPARNGRLRLLALARLQPQKNPFGLLEAVNILRKEEPALDVTVDWHGDRVTAGDRRASKWARSRQRGHTEYAERFDEAVERLGLGDKFRLRPASPDVLSLYHAADALVLPSVYEGTPNVVCEAMACGLPVLAEQRGRQSPSGGGWPKRVPVRPERSCGHRGRDKAFRPPCPPKHGRRCAPKAAPGRKRRSRRTDSRALSGTHRANAPQTKGQGARRARAARAG